MEAQEDNPLEVIDDEPKIKISEHLKHFFHLEFLWRKDRLAPLMNLEETRTFIDRYNYLKYEMDMPYVEYITHHNGYIDNNGVYQPYFNYEEMSDRLKMIEDVLDLYPDNLFLCGGALVSAMSGEPINDYDIFFCCKDYKEAESILDHCLKYIYTVYQDKEGHGYQKIDVGISQGVITVKYFLTGYDKWITVQFIRRVYENPFQMLSGFDFWACQHGWNSKMGYFTIPTGAFSLASMSFPVDTTKRSFTYEHRLEKYFKRQFRILLPGVEKNHKTAIITPDGKLRLKCCNGVYRECQSTRQYLIHDGRGDEITKPCTRNCQVTVFRLNDNFGCNREGSDYNGHYVFSNGRNEKDGRPEAIVLWGNSLTDVYTMSFDLVKKNFVNRTYCFHPNVTNPSFYSDEELLVVRDRLAEVLECPEKRWRWENPGGQYFGRFNPIIEEPEKWYGYPKPKYYIGIEPKIYVTLRSLHKRNELWKRLPADVFKLILRLLFMTNLIKV